MTTKVPGIPLPTKDNLLQIANAVKEVIEVREGVRGDPMDKAVTFRDLEALKLVQQTGTARVRANIDPNLPVQPLPGVAPGAFKPDDYDETSDLNTPPAPVNLQADGAYSAINLSWSYPAYRNHAYTEIFRSYVNDLTTAQIIGTTSGTLYSDPVGTEKKLYYWVRNVSMADVRSAYNSTGGTYGETAVDVERRIAEVEAEILNDPLTKSLSDRIKLLENTGTSFISELRRIEAGQASLTSQVVAQDINNRSAIEVNQSAIAGVSAQYTVKIDVNGHVSGFGLATTTVNSTPTSAFIVRADKFAIVDPATTNNSLTNTPSADAVPFSVVNGQTFIKAAFIQDASITNAKIQNLSADKITAGTITAAVDLRSPIVRSGLINPGQSGFYLGQYFGVNRFYVGNGTTGLNGRSLEFDGVNTIVRGDIYAYNGTIGGCNITGSYIQSTNYVFGTSGWRLDSNGNLYANNGTFAGALASKSGTIGGLTIANAGIYSPNFVDGVSGWGIDAAGQAQFNSIAVGRAQIGTLQLAGNAVTLPTAVQQPTNSSVTISQWTGYGGSYVWFEILRLSVDLGISDASINAKALVGFTLDHSAGGGGAWMIGWRVRRADTGAVIGEGASGVANNTSGPTVTAVVFDENAGNGTKTYILEVSNFGDISTARAVSRARLFAMGAKR